MARPELVTIGKFGRPHGTRGEVRLFLFNPQSELLEEGMQLYVEGRDESAELVSIRKAAKFSIARLEGSEDRDAAAELRNREVSVARSEFPEIEEDEFYLADVLGAEVRLREDDGFRVIGQVDGFLEPVDDVMIVTGPDIRGRLLVPLTEYAIEMIDLEDEYVMLAPLEEWAPEDFSLDEKPEASSPDET